MSTSKIAFPKNSLSQRRAFSSVKNLTRILQIWPEKKCSCNRKSRLVLVSFPQSPLACSLGIFYLFFFSLYSVVFGHQIQSLVNDFAKVNSTGRGFHAGQGQSGSQAYAGIIGHEIIINVHSPLQALVHRQCTSCMFLGGRRKPQNCEETHVGRT